MKTRSSKSKGSQQNNRPPTSPPLRSPPPSSAKKTTLSSAALEDQSVASPSITVSSARSRASLSLHVQKQLAKDIEASGGIKLYLGSEHNLCELLANREELYGKRADKIRRAISKKVYRWKLLDRDGQYVEKVLNRFKISSAAIKKLEEREQRTNVNRNRANIKKDKSGDSSLSSSSSSSSSESSSDSSISSRGKVLVASALTLPPVKDFPPRFIEAPKPKTAVIEALKTTPKPRNLSLESFPVEAKMSNAKQAPRSPSFPLPRDTGK
jgi:hypothetical protein